MGERVVLQKFKLDDEVRRRLRRSQDPLQPARHPAAAREREILVAKVRDARQQIAQIFLDYDHWNRHVRKPHELLVDPDPDGDLRLLGEYYDRLLKHDTQ